MPASIAKKPSDRTHEENQERAYIAASRRSDRSVEARVESARRASEIHKRRTGKSLKVTEKDVLAEEMYEEEEDELPSQYKNLNAHLQTGSQDFDARLQAYLANAVAFRKALSGVTKNRDKSKNVDFVNTRQLADHEALFPKHSDAWKDIIIPKSAETCSSPFLPQGTTMRDAKNYNLGPYDSKNSGMSSRRMSMGLSKNNGALESMGTLRPSDLKERPVRNRPTSRHPSLPQPAMARQNSPNQATEVSDLSMINYNSLNLNSAQQSPTFSSASDSSPFSSKLPANAIDMLMPYMQWTQKPDNSYYDFNLVDSPFHTKPQDTIDATLLAPSSDKAASASLPMPVADEYAPQTHAALWQQSQYKESSANRKLVEDNMWGTFINDPQTEAWDWSGTI